MTTIRKMAISTIAAAAVFGVSANAGTLAYTSLTGGTASLKIAQELFNTNPTLTNVSVLGAGMPAVGSGQIPVYRGPEEFSYTASIGGSGTVSDATINLDFPNLATTDLTLGGGATYLSLYDITTGVVVAIADLTTDIVSYTIANTTDDPLNERVGESGARIVFTTNSSQSIINSRSYAFRVTTAVPTIGGAVPAPAGTLDYTGTQADFDALEAVLDVWTGSGTPIFKDRSRLDMVDILAQYKVECETKLDNLINVENSSTVFVATNHGALNTANGSAGDVMDVLTDVFRFKVTKTAVDIGLDGDTSKLQIIPSNAALAALTGLTVTAATFADGTIATVTSSTLAPDGVTLAFDIDSANGALGDTYTGLNASTNTYTVSFQYNGTTVIPESSFIANYYINSDDAITLGGNFYDYTPADSYTPDQNIGEWENFAYKAQIAGATQTDVTITKLFIANRSCKAVNPELTFILDGKTVTVTLDSVAVDSQGKFLLSDVIAANAAAFTAAGMPTTGRYALELTIPGNAEDFYVYAQAQSTSDLAATKDLPVYNTSTRSN